MQSYHTHLILSTGSQPLFRPSIKFSCSPINASAAVVHLIFKNSFHSKPPAHPQVVQRPAPPGPLYQAQNHGDGAFGSAAARLWKSLPADPREVQSLDSVPV
ncbi:hypothetical protein ILYODFUR_036035 [Ilyodon furcidens]|uniref:Uncharacterized protein n=1 Tax=Ilyodon furcidens TaxID=33524 RepID=A0ABV0TE90_9TELE